MNEPIDDISTVEIDGTEESDPTAARSDGTRRDHPDPREQLAQAGPIDETELIELLCSDQVHRWRSGERIPAEAYLSLHPTLHGHGEAAFELIYGEYLIRESLGESPKLEEFFWRFPDFAERLRRQLGLHRALGEASPRTEMTLSGERDGEAADWDDEAIVPVVSGFEILGILGKGGMSVVYLARQVGLNRLVALKVIRGRIYADPEIAARFRDEAEAAARFLHPNIIQVYEIGEFEGQGYLVLEYAPGGSLQQKLAGTPQSPRDAARTIEHLARALHYAHQHGIIHRDLKPANVVLTEDGLPKVTDFGLAKLMEREAGLTRTGDIMGTPSYMAPEQARGTPADVTAATDIYSLGAILYEMLTGRPPFKGATPLSTLGQLAGQEVLPPGRLQRHLPREIETICLKCLEKDPRKRYASALDLADDLRRFLENRPILARRISRAEWLWRWCRREPVKAALASGLVLAVLAGFLGVASQMRRAEEKARAAAASRDQAEQAKAQALQNLYNGRFSQARLEWRLNNTSGARRLLDGCDPSSRGWEWHYLNNLDHSVLFSYDLPAATYINAVAFSPDGKRFAFAGFNPFGPTLVGEPNPVELWDTATHQRLGSFAGTGPTLRLSFSPDGRLLVASGPDEARLWDTETGKTLRSWKGSGTFTFSPDGKTLASCSNDRVAFWDPSTGARIRDFPSSTGQVTYLPGGSMVAISGPESVELRDVTSGHEIRRLLHGPSEPEERHRRFFGGEGPLVAFSPDGRLAIVATNPPRVWDTNTGVPLFHLSGHDGSVTGVAFSPDGCEVATAGVDSTIRLWDVQTGAERAILRGHRTQAGCVAYHPAGWSLLSGGRLSADLKLWDLTRDPDHLSLPEEYIAAMKLVEDGRFLELLGAGGRLKRRETASGRTVVGKHLEITQKWLTPAVLAEFSGDGRRLATIADDRKTIKVWDAESGRHLLTLQGLSVDATALAVNFDGSRIAATGGERSRVRERREVVVWDGAAGHVLSSIPASLAATPYTHGHVVLDTEGRRVAFDDYEDSAIDPKTHDPLGKPRVYLRVCEVADGRDLSRLPLPDAGVVYGLAFSQDGQRLAASESHESRAEDQIGKVWIWDTQTGAGHATNQWDDLIYRLAFSPDGRLLAGVSRTGVEIRDVDEGREVLILRGAPHRVNDGGFNPLIAWSSDGGQLATTNWDGSISVWDGSERTISPDQRWAEAESRVFGWHLAMADWALTREQRAAAASHLDQIRTAVTPDLSSLKDRAKLHLRLGHRDEAEKDFVQWLARGASDDGYAWLWYAQLLLIRNDGERYRSLCADAPRSGTGPFLGSGEGDFAGPWPRPTSALGGRAAPRADQPDLAGRIVTDAS